MTSYKYRGGVEPHIYEGELEVPEGAEPPKELKFAYPANVNLTLHMDLVVEKPKIINYFSSRLGDLRPGRRVRTTPWPSTREEDHATFCGLVEPHPIWPEMVMVVWRMGDGSWSHDAMSPLMEMSHCVREGYDAVQRNLKRALLDESQWKDGDDGL